MTAGEGTGARVNGWGEKDARADGRALRVRRVPCEHPAVCRLCCEEQQEMVGDGGQVWRWWVGAMAVDGRERGGWETLLLGQGVSPRAGAHLGSGACLWRWWGSCPPASGRCRRPHPAGIWLGGSTPALPTLHSPAAAGGMVVKGLLLGQATWGRVGECLAGHC